MEPLIHREIYLDNNATTQPLHEVQDAMLEILGVDFGNPSSIHASGERSREHIRLARERVAKLIGVEPTQVIFTSSGTEANNMALASVLRSRATNSRVVTTQVEHSSILKFCEYLSGLGVEVVYLPVNRAGQISITDLKASLTSDTVLVSVQWVNNETGVIQPVEVIRDICRERGIPFHTDAAQAVGKLAIDVSSLAINLLTLTGHKFHGPQGIGALYAQDRRWLYPMFHGGPQEFGLRAGTENVPGIVGMGKAAELRLKGLKSIQKRLCEMRDRFEKLLLEMIQGTEVNGDRNNRVCNTTNILFSNVDGQALVVQLDQFGIRCSQSSACTNQRPEPSYVLRAMGLSEDEAYSSVRFSFSVQNTLEDVSLAAMKIVEICEKQRSFTVNRRSVLAN